MKTLWPDPSTLDISPHQREQLALAFRSRLGMLFGQPGTGKTYSIAAAIRAIIRQHGASSICMFALTGKAAKQIQKALFRNGLDLPTATIHRTLGIKRAGYDGKGWTFQHDQQHPLPHKFYIGDEWSMPDVDISQSLFSAIPPNAHVCLTGDLCQLPPVGHGAPFRDMRAAGLPFGELSEIRRNSGDIVRVCSEIRRGMPYRPSVGCSEADGRNLPHRDAGSPAAILRELKRMMESCPRNINPMTDVQVLAPLNDSGDLSREIVNEMLQNLLNPHKASAPGCGFREGDRVMCRKNSWLDLHKPEIETITVTATTVTHVNGKPYSPADDTDDKQFVANGEVGILKTIAEKWLIVELSDPTRLVKVPLGKQKKEKQQTPNKSAAKREKKESDDGGVTGTAGNWELAYCQTPYTAQGSQWPVVIPLVDPSGGGRMNCSLEWWITSLSRAERLCVPIGSRAIIDLHCKRQALPGRKTFLESLIRERVGVAT